jgi:hypothetical protein
MTHQGWKDWEDYNNGLVGVSTGSGFNQMGLQDRKKGLFGSEPKVRRQKNEKNQKPRKPTIKSVQKKESDQWKIFFFFVGLIVGVVCVSEAGVNDPVAYVFGGLIGGGIFAAFYKVILAVGIAAIGFGILSNF